MQITASALSLNVPDVAASADFATRHLGFTEAMAEDGFFSLPREDAGLNLVFRGTGLGSFNPASIAGDAGQGTLVAFVVDTIDDEYERLRAEGVPIFTPIETEPWGERYFQMRDPNGIVYQLVQWVDEPSSAS